MTKNQKLNGLLHKLVELKDSTDHVKGFLFQDNRGKYFIKPIEVYAGSAQEAGKFYLNEKHVEFTNFCESPKLMKVSMKSWHYRLMKYVLRSNVPTPQTMQNGCPYFWLLVFSILVVPFLFVLRGFWQFCLGFPYLFWKALEAIANITINLIPEEEAYRIDYDGWRGSYDLPILAKKHFMHTNDRFLPRYIKIKYGISAEKDKEAYDKKVEELKEAYARFIEQERINTLELSKKKAEVRDKARELQAKREKLAEERRKRMRLFWKPLTDSMNSIGKSISKAATLGYSRATIIKRTKQFIGFLISIALLIFTAALAMFTTHVILVLIDGVQNLFANHLTVILYVLASIVALAILVGVGYLIYNWIQQVIVRYKAGKKIWYAQAFMYSIVYPIKYSILGVFYLLLYVIYTPIKFIFYSILWKIVLVNTGLLLWSLLLALGRLVMKSIGIFGEYFGASKKDYCPGIEWIDVE